MAKYKFEMGEIEVLKKHTLKVIFFFLSFGLLLGCGKTKEDSGNISEKPTNMPKDHIVSSDEGGKHGGDKNPDEEGKGGEDDNLHQENNNTLVNSKEEDTNIIFEKLENYKESNIPSVYTQDNPDERYSNVLLNENNEIEYYTYADEADGYHIWKYTLKEGLTAEEIAEDAASEAPAFWTAKNGAAWVREPVLWLGDFKEKIIYQDIIIFRGQDQNEYAWYMGDEEGRVRAYLLKRIGDSYMELPVSEWRVTDAEHATVAVLANGNVVMADAGRECFIYDQKEGSLLTSFKCGWYESICVRGNQVYISARGGASVQCYDAQKQEFLPVLEAAFDNSVRIALQEDDVYVCTPTGFFRAKESGGTGFQKILEAGTFHFSKESVVLLKFFVVGDAFYVVYGEDRVNIKRYAPAGEGEETAHSLTVYSLESNDVILDMISEFQDQYPDIELIYETGEGAAGSTTVADRIRALNTRILAGDGPDVLLLDGLPVESYIEKGILEDLSPVLGSRKEDFLTNVLSAYTVQDKIYMLPLRIKIPAFMTSGQKPELYSTLEALVEYSESEGGVANVGYTYADYLQILYYNYTPDIVTEDKAVNKEALAEFLSLAKRFCDAEQPYEAETWEGTYLWRPTPSFDFAVGETDLCFLCANGAFGLATNPAEVEARNGEIINNQGIFFPNGLLGMNRLSAKKENANLFIKYAFSYEIQKREVSWSGYPIDTKLLDEYMELDCSSILSGNSKVTLRWFTAEESARMIRIVKKVHTPFTVEGSVWEIFQEGAKGYLKGTKSLEEAVDEIAGGIQLYLYE